MPADGAAIRTPAWPDDAVVCAGECRWGGAAGTLFRIDPVEDLIANVRIQRMDGSWRLRDEVRARIDAAIVD